MSRRLFDAFLDHGPFQITAWNTPTARPRSSWSWSKGRHSPTGLPRGPFPVDEALPIAKQIADALEAAHEQGIVHRDLKPANIKVRDDGSVKVLDFGLAKAMDAGAGRAGGNVSQSPTLTTPAMTQAGMILGTAAYMSPEQAKGKTADSGSDIWSFGVVLFEMLTGKRAFEGETVVEILGGVMKAEPDWAALPADAPPRLVSVLRRCLQKDRSRRYHSAADARLDIEDALTPQPAIATASSRKTSQWMWVPAALVLAAGAGYAVAYFRPAPAAVAETRLQVVTPPAASLQLAVAPDDRSLVFSATVDGKSGLSVRSFDSDAAKPLPDSDGGASPFWSPDSRTIGFFAGGKLKRIDIGSGTAQTLADANGNYGGTWSADGTILFTPAKTSPLYRIPATGGVATPVTALQAPRQGSHRWPSFLPDNRHFLFFVSGAPDAAGVYVGSLDTEEVRRLFSADTAAVFRSPDYLLFGRQGILFAQRFSTRELELVGNPFSIAENVAINYAVAGQSGISAAADGPIAYRTGRDDTRQLIWFDRSGNQTGVVGEPDTASLGAVRLSPDGRTAAVSRTVDGNGDIWLVDTGRGLPRRFTSDPAFDANPHWSPDGSHVVFESFRIKSGIYNFFEQAVDGGGSETVLLESPENKNLEDWSPDGKFILYTVQSPKTDRDLWAMPLPTPPRCRSNFLPFRSLET